MSPRAAQPPRLMRGGLSGRVYVVLRYRDLDNGSIEALEKHDVTDDFAALESLDRFRDGYQQGFYDAARGNPSLFEEL